MQPQELEHYLHRHIPLAQTMAVAVLHADAVAVVLRAPLAPNLNPHGTVFGGSAATLALLAAWSLLHLRLQAEGMVGELVIQRSTMEYERPLSGEFTARAVFDDAPAWQRFTRMLGRKGKARIGVSAVLEQAGVTAGRFTGEFVALGDEPR